jgi:histidine decarboxylase
MTYLNELSTEDKKTLDDIYSKLEKASQNFAGYPCNTEFDYSELYRFLNFTVNNIGDPFHHSNYHLNTHEIEQEVIRFFASLYHAGDEYIGYVTHGGTEGNFFGLNLALAHLEQGIIYHSSCSHYSIKKIIRVLHADSCEVPALDNGEISYDLLKKAIIKNRDKPVIINANIGTTMKGAIDNISKIKALIQELDIKQYHIHCDAALSGLILPFLDTPPPFDFQSGIHSVAISGHKFIGSPIPCGIVLTNKKTMDHSPFISYVEIIDNTISGSRNGITPLFLWYAIKRYGTKGFKEMVGRCFENIDYTVSQLNKMNIPAWKNDHSITAVFPKPSERITNKWQLATHKDISHIMVMPHVTNPFIDTILTDLKEDQTCAG